MPRSVASCSPRILPVTHTTPPRTSPPRPRSLPASNASLADPEADLRTTRTAISTILTVGGRRHPSRQPITAADSTRARTQTDSSSFSRVNTSAHSLADNFTQLAVFPSCLHEPLQGIIGELVLLDGVKH